MSNNQPVWWRTAARVAVILLLIATVAAAVLVREARNLPSAAVLRASLASHYPPDAARGWKPLWAISPRLVTSVVLWEDPSFYHHSGFSPRAMWRALWFNIRAGAYARGASTLSQQIAKNLFLTREKTLRRKFRDVVLARRLEHALAKDEILEIYLNTAEWGEGVHGADAASQRYFGVAAADLEWSQAALLTGILSNPHTLNPCTFPESAAARRNIVLGVLLEEAQITPAEFHAAASAPLAVRCGAAPRMRATTAG